MDEIISQAEAARRLDVKRQAIGQDPYKRIAIWVDKKINWTKSKPLFKRYLANGLLDKTSSNLTNENLLDRPLPGESTVDAAQRIIQESGATMDIDEAKRVKENYLALLNELDYDIKSGKVVLFEDALKSVGEQYARVRTRLLAIPSEQAPRVHRLKTVAEVQDCLLDIITEALEELTKDGGISK